MQKRILLSLSQSLTLYLTLSFAFTSALALLLPLSAQTAEAAQPQLKRSVVLDNLSSPWDIAFTPDGVMFFTEKCRGLSVRQPNGKVAFLFGEEGAALPAKDLFCEGQSGITGVTLDPDFNKNRTLYVYMSSNLSKNPRTNRVVRLKVDENFSRVSERKDIITDIDYKNVGNAWGGPGAHSGGRLRFGPDGFLYVPTGDNHNGPLPQDPRRLGGKVLRVNRDGKAAPGNKTPEGGD
ncbi:MAG: PQQ-dependent sugar dehydrogenase, partial [Bdellovibrionaceae bacterium]|nr:PQQ-dependent sugar dehydrogenase [Pseudobdellovibrionaceae bacterium]